MKENSVDNKTPQTLTTGFSVGTPGGVAGGRKPITLISDLSRYLAFALVYHPLKWADNV